MLPPVLELRVCGAGFAALLLLLAGCAGDVVVRAPLAPQARGESALSRLPSMAVSVPPITGAGSASRPVGERSPGLGFSKAPIYLTEDPGLVLQRLVREELASAGHRVVDSDADVVLSLRFDDFSVRMSPAGLRWDVEAAVRLAVLVLPAPGATEVAEFVYSAERSGQTFLWPGISTTERILADCLEDLAGVLASHEGLAAGLRQAKNAGG